MSKNPAISPNAALEKLKAGNVRFVNGLRSIDAVLSTRRLSELAKGQAPFAIVLTCSDSRVPAEIIFDQGLGDLFVIRVAGNVIAPSLLASIEFAALNFKTPLCVVMGHSQCGAVKATLASQQGKSGELTANLESLVGLLRPPVQMALEVCHDHHSEGELVRTATLLNVQHTKENILKQSPALAKLVEQGSFKIVGAHYDLETGHVALEPSISDNPNLLKGKSLHSVDMPRSEHTYGESEQVSVVKEAI